MQDLETKTFWSHVTGKGIIGELAGKKLPTLPSVQTTWAQWVKTYPGTKVLQKSKEVRSSRYERYFKNQKRFGILPMQYRINRLPGKQLISGVTNGPFALAVPDTKIKKEDFHQTTLGEENILIVRAPDGGVRAFIAQIDGQNIRFKNGSYTRKIIDKKTGSVWNTETGICVAGKMKGKQLKELQVTIAYWFAWSTFYPNTEVIE